ncbi:MAG: nuclear transport factor 2 family protein [bacterium]
MLAPLLALSVALLAPAPGVEEAARTLDAFHAAAARADEAAYFGLFDPDGVFVGTDATEVWSVEAFRAYAHPFFAKGKAWTMVPDAAGRRIRLAADGKTAWFYEPLAHEKYGALRGSGALVRGPDGGFRVAQYILSFAVPNDRADAVIQAVSLPAAP